MVTPSLNLLNRKQLDRVHRSALRILARVGMQVDWPEARERLGSKGCAVGSDGRVFFTEETIEWAISSAPSSIGIFNQKGDPAFTLGERRKTQTRFGIGCTNLYYQHPLTDALTPFQLDHVMGAARLADRLENFDLLSTPGIPRDLDPATADLHVTLEMMANTLKPLVVLVSEHDLFEPVLDLVTHLFPENRQKPFVIPYVNPITPLVMNTGTLKKMVSTIRRGLPIIYNNYGMAGATVPITPGGSLALLTAELLAGLSFAQVVCPGTPVILGSLPAGFNMREMMSVYTPHTVLLNLACAEMMAHYQLPHSGTSGSGPGWGTDLLAGGAFWLNHLTACMGKVGLAPFVGGNLDSMAFSPPAVVYADEVIRQARIFKEGFDLSEAAVAIDEIAAIGPAGNYLESDQTFERFRELSSESHIWPERTLENWTAAGSPRAETILREHTVSLLEDSTRASDRVDIRHRGNEFIRNLDLPGIHQ